MKTIHHFLLSPMPKMDEQLEETYDDCSRWIDEEFYGSSSPTDDIWDKFELNSLDTPPTSPNHDSFEDNTTLCGELDMEHIVTSCFSTKDKQDSTESKHKTVTCELCCGPLNSKLIQDCMWSGPGLLVEPTLKMSTKCSTDDSKTTQRTRTISVADVPKSSECVSPTAVFPVSMKTPKSLASTVDVASYLDTPSPSESEEEDDEEIDVVTVGDKSRRVPPAESAPSRSYSWPQAPHYHDHHYSAPQSPHTGNVSVLKRRRPMSVPCSPHPASKKHRMSVNESELKRAVQKLRLPALHRSGADSTESSRSSSDSEEGGEGKRAQHNVLERKRRNDLKYSFCVLRASVPEIQTSERAPKVVILKKASQYIHNMRNKHKALEAEYERHKKLNDQLRRKMASLRKSEMFM